MLIQLAGMAVDLRTKTAYVERLCLPYRAPDGAVADFTVTVSDEDILREAAGDMSVHPALCESAAIYRALCHRALDFDAFLFHGSALALDGVGYLFTAPSGTGKSTHASLWRQRFGARVVTVNDDKPLLRVKDGGVEVCGTPWDGKHHLSTPANFPLRAICLLERGEENHITRITAREAYPCLLGQTYRPADPALLAKTLALLDRAMAHLAFYKLTCNMNPEAAEVAMRGMTEA